MKLTRPALPIRPLAYLLAVAGLAVPTFDAGSIMLTRFSVADGVRASGQAAAKAIEELPTSRQTSALAYRVATQEAESYRLTLSSEDFLIYPDGRVQVTGSRTAPTMLLGHLGPLGEMVSISDTLTVSAPTFS